MHNVFIMMSFAIFAISQGYWYFFTYTLYRYIIEIEEWRYSIWPFKCNKYERLSLQIQGTDKRFDTIPLIQFNCIFIWMSLSYIFNVYAFAIFIR